MKNHLRLLLITLAFAMSAMPNFAAGFQSKEFRRAVAFDPGGDLTLRTDKGSVRLISWDQPQVEVYARIEPPEDVSEDYGRRAVEAARVEVIGSARALTIRSNFDDVPYQDGILHRSRTLPHIHYEVRAPRRLNLNLDVDRCRVSLEGFAGRINLKTDRTPVTASDLVGELRLRMDRGQATLSGLQGSLDLETDRTDSRLQGVRLEGDSRLHIGRGECELVLPGSQGLSLSASIGRRESLQTDFAITTQSFNRDVIEGTINGGGPRLTIQGDRSVIRLKRAF
jgi:hypothetical protein